jgi:hypothetical protein
VRLKPVAQGQQLGGGRVERPHFLLPPAVRSRRAHACSEGISMIRAVLAATPFHGEGYRKVRARLAHRGLAIGGKRVLRLMRVHHLLAPRRLGPPNGDPAHAGTITTTRPDEMWGTDETRFYTEEDGWCWFFGAIDHGIDELVGWHTAKIGDRWAALEPLRQGVRHVFGRFAKEHRIRSPRAMYCGPHYDGVIVIPSHFTLLIHYVGEPECNGVIERFMRTLKEQCLYLIASRVWPRRAGSSASSSGATTPSGSSSHRMVLGEPEPRTCSGEVLSLLDNETGMHSCLEPKTQASPVSAGGKRRHPRAHENTGIGADKPEAR